MLDHHSNYTKARKCWMKTWSAAVSGYSGLTSGAYSVDTPLAVLSGIPAPHPSSFRSS